MRALRPCQTFGSWVIESVQCAIGLESIFAGDEDRQQQIRTEFDEACGELVRWSRGEAARMALERTP